MSILFAFNFGHVSTGTSNRFVQAFFVLTLSCIDLTILLNQKVYLPFLVKITLFLVGQNIGMTGMKNQQRMIVSGYLVALEDCSLV